MGTSNVSIRSHLLFKGLISSWDTTVIYAARTHAHTHTQSFISSLFLVLCLHVLFKKNKLPGTKTCSTSHNSSNRTDVRTGPTLPVQKKVLGREKSGQADQCSFLWG